MYLSQRVFVIPVLAVDLFCETESKFTVTTKIRSDNPE